MHSRRFRLSVDCALAARLGTLLAASAVAMVAGCSSGGTPAKDADDGGATPRLTGSDSDAAAKDLAELYKLMKQPPSARQRERDTAQALPTRVAPKTTSRPAPVAKDEAIEKPVEVAADIKPVLPAANTPAMPAPPTPEERQVAIVAELIELLRERSAGSEDASGDAALMSLLSSLDPASVNKTLGEMGKGLSPKQQEALSALQSLASELPAAMSKDGGELAALLERIARQVGGQPLSLPTVALCARVESFGRFTPLTSSTFMVGRAQPAIVYTEVANFAHQPAAATGDGSGASGEEQWVVELSQRIMIYHSDNTLAWSRPAQTIRDVSRNVRRDYYLVQRIDLPPTLTVGSYSVKVSVRDLQSGAVAEQVIPIKIVADEGLAGK